MRPSGEKVEAERSYPLPELAIFVLVCQEEELMNGITDGDERLPMAISVYCERIVSVVLGRRPSKPGYYPCRSRKHDK
jgi:hypothetical protein